MNILISTTSAADYQYQLEKIDFYPICQTAGTVTLKWDEMPDIYFPNGAVAEIQRYSVCEPNPSGNQGAWYKGLSRTTTSYTFEGLDPSKTYSFDMSADYYIKNTIYYDSSQPKYIKFYSKELFQPIPQDTPTPAPTDTPTPSPTPVVTDTPAPTVVPVTSAPVDMVTVNPNATSATEQTGGSNSVLTTLLVVLIVLIAAITGLVIYMFVKMNMNKPSGPGIQAPPRQ